MAIIGNTIKRGMQFRNKFRRENIPLSQHQTKTLKRLLKESTQTSFGKYYGFKEILKSDQIIQLFQDRVPFHDYDSMHDQWWHRSLNNEENVAWKGRVKYFALSSGTSGSPSKHIPITDDMLRSNKRAGVKMFFSLTQYDTDPALYAKGMMMLGGSTDLQSRGDYFVGDLSGINAKENPFWIRKMYKPGVKIAAINNWDERIKQIVKNAPAWDIGFIMGIPAWNQLMIEKIITHYKVDTIHDIWPNLKVYVHGGVSFEPYKKGFEKLMGKPMIYMDTYLASEGFLAFQARPETKAMALIPNNGIFFEFIPFNEQFFDENGDLIGNPKALTIKEVQTGIDYAIIISTNAGAWRYLIGDTIRFTNLEKAEILITGRTKHFLSICGEHLSVENMQTAINAVEEKFDISIPEFTVSGVTSGQFFAHKWYLGCNHSALDKQAVIAELDHQLKRTNDDYKTERDGTVLKDIQLEIVPTHTFVKWFAAKDKLGGQSKFPRVMKKDRFEEWENFVKTVLK